MPAPWRTFKFAVVTNFWFTVFSVGALGVGVVVTGVDGVADPDVVKYV